MQDDPDFKVNTLTTDFTIKKNQKSHINILKNT